MTSTSRGGEDITSGHDLISAHPPLMVPAEVVRAGTPAWRGGIHWQLGSPRLAPARLVFHAHPLIFVTPSTNMEQRDREAPWGGSTWSWRKKRRDGQRRRGLRNRLARCRASKRREGRRCLRSLQRRRCLFFSFLFCGAAVSGKGMRRCENGLEACNAKGVEAQLTTDFRFFSRSGCP